MAKFNRKYIDPSFIINTISGTIFCTKCRQNSTSGGFLVYTTDKQRSNYLLCIACAQPIFPYILSHRTNRTLKRSLRSVIKAYAFHATTGTWPDSF
jgi:hypothetical protein